MTKFCEDCGGTVGQSEAEIAAQAHDLVLCDGCIQSYADEQAAWEQEHGRC